jgi:hypothetical protein
MKKKKNKKSDRRRPRRLSFGERENRRPFMRAAPINYANRLTGGPPINIFMAPALRRTFSKRPEQIQSCKPGLILERAFKPLCAALIYGF